MIVLTGMWLPGKACWYCGTNKDSLRERMPMKVIANLNLCQGHARCEDLCPEVFTTDEVEGKVVVLQPKFPLELEGKVRLAVRNCPEGALRIARGTDA